MKESARKVRILHVTLNMEIGGTEQVIKQLVANTDAERFEVLVLCIDGVIGAMGQSLIEDGFDVTSLKRSPGFDRHLIVDIKALVKSRQIDILHCHQYTPYVYGLLASIGTTRVPVLYTEHGRLYPESYKWKRYLLNPLLSLLTHSIVSISKATADALVKYENFPRRKIEVIYNGLRYSKVEIDRRAMLAELELSLDSIVLGTISRLDPIKNQPLMIRAFAEAVKEFPKAVLLIVGDGCDRQRLEDCVDELGIRENVRFTGFKVVPQPYFELLDIFLLSSLSEGTSMTLLEAMACSKPSVVTNVGGNPEIVQHEETGYVTADQDQEGFARAIKLLLGSEELRTSMGKAAQIRYQNFFSETKMLANYEKKYLSLAAD